MPPSRLAGINAVCNKRMRARSIVPTRIMDTIKAKAITP